MLLLLTGVLSCIDKARPALPDKIQRLTYAGGEEGAREAVHWQAG